MVQVKFTRHLARFFPTLDNPTEVDGRTVADIIHNLDRAYPGLVAYIVDERGRLPTYLWQHKRQPVLLGRPG